MKASFYINFLMLFCLFSETVFAQQDKQICKSIDEIARAESRRFGVSALEKKTATFDATDITALSCHWTIDPSVRRIDGDLSLRFRTKIGIDFLDLDLSDTLSVVSVFYHGTSLAFVHENDVLHIPFGKYLPANTFDSLQITYGGVPKSSGLGSYRQALHEGVPVIWTLSEPYGSSDWWPCKNRLEDKIDSLDIFFSCPVKYKGIANGRLVSVDTSDDGTMLTMHWQHRYPIAHYLIGLAVTNYEEFSFDIPLGEDNLLMQTFCYPESRPDYEARNNSTANAMQLFHHLVGPYPFIREKYGHTQFSWGGGMEHQTNSFIYSADPDLIAHELAHQWFGDKITCASWEDLWLNEGFATHMASIYYELYSPDKVYSSRKAEIEKICADTGGSVRIDDVNNISRVFSSRLTYTKGSHLLYMLRWKLGDSVFFHAVRNYLKDTALAYHYASTPDLQRHLEEESGQSLDSFFRQWYVGQGYPSFHVRWSQLSAGTVQLELGQQTSHSSVSFFNIPLALQFRNAVQDTTIVVEGRYDRETFTADIGFVADTVILDPEYWLISSGNTSEQIEHLVDLPQRINVYPNPFDDVLELALRDFPYNKVKLALYDMQGKVLLEKVIAPLYNGKTYLRIELPFLACGQYVLKVWDELGDAESVLVTKR